MFADDLDGVSSPEIFCSEEFRLTTFRVVTSDLSVSIVLVVVGGFSKGRRCHEMIKCADKEIMLYHRCVIIYVIVGRCFIALKPLIFFFLFAVRRIYAIITV